MGGRQNCLKEKMFKTWELGKRLLLGTRSRGTQYISQQFVCSNFFLPIFPVTGMTYLGGPIPQWNFNFTRLRKCGKGLPHQNTTKYLINDWEVYLTTYLPTRYLPIFFQCILLVIDAEDTVHCIYRDIYGAHRNLKCLKYNNPNYLKVLGYCLA